MVEQQSNWAGNYTYRATQWHEPTSVEAVQDIVRQSKKIKALGSRHSFNAIADSDETIISLKQMCNVIDLDTVNHTVTVEAGMTYGQLAPYLHDHGYALPNLASLPHISIVGACMTATHGSGETNGNLATAVSAIEIVTANGDVIRRSRAEHGDDFAGYVVSLGALGIVTRITLDLIPTFDVRQDIYLNLPFSELATHFDDIQASAYSVSLFTVWENELVTQAWIKRKADSDVTLGDTFYGGTRATVPYNPVGTDRTEHCTEQLGIPGAWHDRLPHFRLEFTPSHGDEIQSEYFVPRESAWDAIQAVNSLHEQITPLLYTSEIRTIASDDLWLSTAYERDSVALHFTWKPMPTEIQPVLKQMESVLMPYDVRPHWGKVFSLPVDRVQAQYTRLDDFRQLMHTLDPDGKFHNDFLSQYIR